MIERNKHHAGRIGNILFGVASILDGLVRVLSFGFLHTRFPIELSKAQAKRIAKSVMLRENQQILKVATEVQAKADKLAKEFAKRKDTKV
jgi:hypothetical protein